VISDHRIPADQVRLSPVETAATPAFRASIRPESSRTPRSFVTEALYGLPGEFCDEDEVLVEMENGAVVQFGCGAISRRGSTGAMLSALGQQALYLHGPVLDRGSQVLHRHRRQGRRPQGPEPARWRTARRTLPRGGSRW
jgi:hypothetical protein